MQTWEVDRKNTIDVYVDEAEIKHNLRGGPSWCIRIKCPVAPPHTSVDTGSPGCSFLQPFTHASKCASAAGSGVAVAVTDVMAPSKNKFDLRGDEEAERGRGGELWRACRRGRAPPTPTGRCCVSSDCSCSSASSKSLVLTSSSSRWCSTCPASPFASTSDVLSPLLVLATYLILGGILLYLFSFEFDILL